MLKPLRGAQFNLTHPLARGLVGYWLFNEGTGDKVFDYSRNGNIGTLTDVGWTGSFDSWAGDFNGSSSGVDTNKTIAGGLSEITIACVMSLDSLVVSQSPFLVERESGGGDNMQFVLETGGTNKIQLGLWLTTFNYLRSTKVFSSSDFGERFFIVGTWKSGSPIKIYINGLLDNESGNISGTINTDVVSLRIGMDGYGHNHDGLISFAGIWRREFLAAEIMSLYLNPYAMFEVPVSPAIFSIDVGRIQDLIGMGIIPFIR